MAITLRRGGGPALPDDAEVGGVLPRVGKAAVERDLLLQLPLQRLGGGKDGGGAGGRPLRCEDGGLAHLDVRVVDRPAPEVECLQLLIVSAQIEAVAAGETVLVNVVVHAVDGEVELAVRAVESAHAGAPVELHDLGRSLHEQLVLVVRGETMVARFPGPDRRLVRSDFVVVLPVPDGESRVLSAAVIIVLHISFHICRRKRVMILARGALQRFFEDGVLLRQEISSLGLLEERIISHTISNSAFSR